MSLLSMSRSITVQVEEEEVAAEVPLAARGGASAAAKVRPLISSRDDRLPLYVQAHGARVGRSGDCLEVRTKDGEVTSVRLRDTSHVCVFGSVQLTHAALSDLCERDIGVSLVSISNSVLHDALMRGNDAQLAVKFASKLISVTRDRAENVVDGSPDKVVDMVDVWTFARDVRSGNPNWRLIATDAGHA